MVAEGKEHESFALIAKSNEEKKSRGEDREAATKARVEKRRKEKKEDLAANKARAEEVRKERGRMASIVMDEEV